jgi:hypothetical protein
LFAGLLTVDPKRRLTMQDLLNNEWISGKNQEVFSTTPLATPDVLSLTRSTMTNVQNQISATMNAFHKAHRAGFRLQDISKAPLARRRKLMREEGHSSGSTDSSRASTPVPPVTVSAALPSVSVLFSSGNTPPCGVGIQASSPIGTELFAGRVLDTVGDGSRDNSCCSTPVLPFENAKFAAGSSLLDVDSNQAVMQLLSCKLPCADSVSVGFSPANSPASGLLECISSRGSSPHQSPAGSRSSTPRHFLTERLLGDLSDGSSPRRSPLFVERNMSNYSLGFSPCVSTGSDNGSQQNVVESSAAAASETRSSGDSSVPGSSTTSQNDVEKGKKRRLQDSTESQEDGSTETGESFDDECNLIESVAGGLSSTASSTSICKKLRSSAVVFDD